MDRPLDVIYSFQHRIDQSMNEPAEDILSIKTGDSTVRATVTHIYTHRIINGNLMTDAVIADKTGTIKAVWFSKQPKEDLVIGSEYIFSGNYQLKYGRLALHSAEYNATGEKPPMDLLAEAPLTLPARNYPNKKPLWDSVPGWIVGLVFWATVIGGVMLYANYSQTQARNARLAAPIAPCTADYRVDPSHNGIPEVHCPGAAESGSSCADVTSVDYDWDDDVMCTRPDGTRFYTNYGGGRRADSSFLPR